MKVFGTKGLAFGSFSFFDKFSIKNSKKVFDIKWTCVIICKMFWISYPLNISLTYSDYNIVIYKICNYSAYSIAKKSIKNKPSNLDIDS